MDGQCVVCCEPIGVFCLGPCDHRSMCMTCGLRLRQLFGDTRCPVCKAENPTILFTGDAHGSYESGVVMCRAGGFDATLKAYFASKMLARKAQLLLSLTCPQCFGSSVSTEPLVFASLPELKDHVSTTHAGRTVCDVCFMHRKVFPHEQLVLTRKELEVHTAHGTPSCGLPPHPSCPYCRSLPPFYSQDELLKHKHDKHLPCLLCLADGVADPFFRNHEAYKHHAVKEHFPCLCAGCDGAIVFRTSLELQSHTASEHVDMSKMSRSERNRARQVVLDFSVAGSRSSQQSQRGGRLDSARGSRRTEAAPKPEQRDPSGQTLDEAVATAKLVAEARFNEVMQTNAFAAPSRQAVITANAELKATLMSSLEATAAAKRASGRKLEPDDHPDARYDTFRELSARYRAGTVSAGDYFRLFQEIFGVEPSWSLFPKLVALLPDMDKRRDLGEVFVGAARANAAQEWFSRVQQVAVAQSEAAAAAPPPEPVVQLAAGSTEVGAKPKAGKQAVKLGRSKGKSDETVSTTVSLPVSADVTLRPAFSALNLAAALAPAPAPAPAPPKPIAKPPPIASKEPAEAVAAAPSPTVMSPAYTQDRLRDRFTVLLRVLGKFVVKLYSEARDPSMFRLTPADEAILDFHVSNNDDFTTLSLLWLPDIGVTPSSAPILENLVQTIMADHTSSDFQPSTHAIVETALASLPPLDVYLFRKYVDSFVKDLQERKSAGYTKKPKPRVWKQPSVAPPSIGKAASARVLGEMIWGSLQQLPSPAIMVGPGDDVVQAAGGKPKLISQPTDDLLFGDPVSFGAGGGRGSAKGPTWTAAAQGQVTSSDTAFPSLGESVGSRASGWPATGSKPSSSTIRKSNTVAASHAAGAWDLSDDSDDMKVDSSKQKKKKSGRQKNLLFSIG